MTHARRSATAIRFPQETHDRLKAASVEGDACRAALAAVSPEETPK